MSANGHDHVPESALRSIIEDARRIHGGSLGRFTVLSDQHDPFRVDTAAGHRDGRWLAEVAVSLWESEQRIHLRGLHYLLVSMEVRKPNGTPYINDDANWKWMSEVAAKAARWLGYVPWRRIVDQRNAAPVVVVRDADPPRPYITAGVEVEIPDADEFEPAVRIKGFTGVQPVKLVIYGEKASLEPVLGPIAERYGADLYLQTGEISDTRVFEMASRAEADGRRIVVFSFADADPAGWQMPISIARKLQAFKATGFPDVEFEVHRVALTPDHVREYGLPSTPLKETEKRASAWTAAMGTAQTEIDALAALQPEVLDRIARAAIMPFFDTTLERRVKETRDEWLAAAQARLEAELGPQMREQIRDEAVAKVAEARELIEQLNDQLAADVPDIELPEVVIPEPVLNGDHGTPLVDSAWEWADQTRALKRDRAYEARS
jgi:hypothetical protein